MKVKMENSGAKKPTFFWQAVLIILPLILLVGVGVYSLRQDRIMAETEAKERAQVLADELHGKILGALSAPGFKPQFKSDYSLKPGVWNNPLFLQIAFQVATNGGLLFPPPVAPLVPSPAPVAKLTGEQTRLWRIATMAEFSNAGPAAAIVAYRQFLDSKPPTEFAARAEFALGVLLQSSETGEAKKTFARVVSEYPRVTSDAGFSLADLARIKSLQPAFTATNRPAKKDEDDLAILCCEAVLQPTALTPMILDLADQWERLHGHTNETNHLTRLVWSMDELSRRLYVAANKKLNLVHASVPSFFWLSEDATNYLIMATNISSSNLWFYSRTESGLRSSVGEILNNTKYVPDYFGISVRLAGLDLTSRHIPFWQHHPGRKASPTAKELDYTSNPALIIASANGPETDAKLLQVNIHLSSPSILLTHQRARTFWFGGLILISTLAALTGLAGAYRSFRQQTRLSEMKTNFVSSVSHELRAPVASMRLMAEALDRGKISDAPKQKEYFRFIVQECRRLSSLVENILDFSRIEQGRKEYEFEPTDLQALVEQTVKLMEPYAAERQVTVQILHSALSTPHSSLSLDGLALQQALINLIDNAIKHSPANATVTIGLETRETTVQLWVEDQGPGIPAEEHEKIFQRFYRLGSELRRETQGIGIGLAIVKHIVTAHGGRVLVKSEINQGSRFTIELPIHNKRIRNHET